MAPLMPLACAAFVSASSFLFSGSSASGPDVEANTDLCLTGINMARSAKLDTRVPVVARDTELEEEAQEAIEAAVTSDSDCVLQDDPTPLSLGGLLLEAADQNAPGDANTITGLIEAQIQAGLKDLGTGYDATSKFNAVTTFTTRSAQNLAHIMFTKSTKVGCAVTKNCSGGHAYIFCKFSEPLTEHSVPFSEALYKALEARKNAGIVLTNLTYADLNTPLTPESGSSSSAIPGAAIIFLSLVGLLATQ